MTVCETVAGLVDGLAVFWIWLQFETFSGFLGLVSCCLRFVSGFGYLALKCLTGFVSLNMITVFEILAFGFMDVTRFWVIWLCYRLCCWRLVFF